MPVTDYLAQFLPGLIMAESFAAAAVYGLSGRWGSALYWFAAGVLNLAVIVGIRRWG